ncbi:DedA family protein [Candidatus Cyrtobacter comes]|nr:DedA family protein [Candidatus Cyrtobacter comes]
MVETFGYLGIFIMTLVEGSFVPIPSEITLIPAGYLIAKGKFSAIQVVFWSMLGTIAGFFLSYFAAYYLGRNLILRYGKYIFIDKKRLGKIEAFFEKHGNISVFIGRILPGLKHFISLPAGLARMDKKLFAIYSTCGAVIWVPLLILIGYFIGDNEELVSSYIKRLNYIIILSVILLLIAYRYLKSSKNERS